MTRPIDSTAVPNPRTGPEHYTEAAAILYRVKLVSLGVGPFIEPDRVQLLVRMAEVHAMLAQAAATALSHREGMTGATAEAWMAAASEPIIKNDSWVGQKDRRGRHG